MTKKNIFSKKNITFATSIFQKTSPKMKKTTKIKENGEVVSNNFIQLTNSETFRKLIKSNSQAAELFLFLVEGMSPLGAVTVSQSTLAEILEISKRTVIRHLEFLIEYNYIKSVKTGGTNIYYINEKIAWKGFGKNRHLAKFSANVILSLKEQSEEYQKQYERENLPTVTLKSSK